MVVVALTFFFFYYDRWGRRTNKNQIYRYSRSSLRKPSSPECIPTPGKNDSVVPCITRSYLHHVLHLLTLGQKIADIADYMPIDATQLLVLGSPDNFDAASLWTPDFPRQEEI